jgi:dehydrogenase/reductase SDR family protein 12
MIRHRVCTSLQFSLVISNAVDKLMDFAVVPGFTRIGYGVRSRSWDSDAPNLSGHDYLVTGASSGLGIALADQLARLGADVHMMVRNLEKGRDAKARLSELTGSDRLHLWECDLADSESILAFAERFREDGRPLRALINNAGSMPPRRTRSADGLELTFATNVAGPFLLTALLLHSLREAAPSRVVNVSSGGMYAKRLQADDLQLEREEYDPAGFYAHTKRCEVILTELWQQRMEGSGISFHSVHPGWADTPGVRDSLPRFRRLMAPILRDAGQGADTISWLCWSDRPLGEPGRFWHDREPRPVHRLPSTRESAGDREWLWEQLVELCGAADLIGEPIGSVR